MPFIGVRISCDMRDRNVVLDRLSSSLYARRSSYCSIRPHSPVVRLKQNRSYPSSSPRVTFSCAHSPFFVRKTVSNGCAPSHARYFFQTETPFCPPKCAPFFIRTLPAVPQRSTQEHNRQQCLSTADHHQRKVLTQHFQPIRYVHSFTCQIPVLLFSVFLSSRYLHIHLYITAPISVDLQHFPQCNRSLRQISPPKKHKKDTEQYRSVSSCINSVLS